MSATTRIRRQLRPLAQLLRSSEERRDFWWELQRRRRGEPALPVLPVRNVLVVCFGNICRSPFAERLLAAGCPQLVVQSGGFEARDGAPAEPNAIEVAAEFGVDLSDHAAHRVTAGDVEWADLIVGMTGRHHGAVRDRWPRHASKVQMLGDFLAGPPRAISDPWGCPEDEFRRVYAQIHIAIAHLSRRLELDTSGEVQNGTALPDPVPR